MCDILTMTPAEQRVLKQLKGGHEADLSDGGEASVKYVSYKEKQWSIRAEFIRQVCCCNCPEIRDNLLRNGFSLWGAKVEGTLNLNFLTIPFSLRLIDCSIPGGISLRQSSLKTLDLSASQTGDIHADGLEVAGEIRLAECFSIKGSACFMGARVLGDFNCANSIFDNRLVPHPSVDQTKCQHCRECLLHSYPLILANARIKGDVKLCGNFIGKGGVLLTDSYIGGNLNTTHGRFTKSKEQERLAKKKSGRRLHCSQDTSYEIACAFNGEGMQIDGNLLMVDALVEGETRLTGASIGKDFDASNSHFHNVEGHAIFGDRIHVYGNVFFSNGFTARGTVRLPRAKIDADLSFCGGQLENSDKESRSLYCEGIRVHGSILLKNSTVTSGYVDLSYSFINGNLDCSDSSFLNTGQYAFNGKGMEVNGSIFLRSKDGEFLALSLVRLSGSRVGLDLICSNAVFCVDKRCEPADTDHALLLENMEIHGKVEMNGKDFLAQGGVCLDYTKIGSFLDCYKACFIAPEIKDNDHRAISAGKLNVYGSVYLDEIIADGEIMFNDANIGRNLILKDALIVNRDSKTLWASQMKVEGYIRMEGFTSLGEVKLNHSIIGGSLVVTQKSRFINREDSFDHNQPQLHSYQGEIHKYAFTAEGIKVGGNAVFDKFLVEGIVALNRAEIHSKLVWKNIESRSSFALYISAAQIGVLADSPESWPLKNTKGRLQLTDCKYQFLEDLTHDNLVRRYTEWLGLTENFRPQPYEQLAAVLRKNGHEQEAVCVLIAKHERSRDLPVKSPKHSDLIQTQSRRNKIYKTIYGWLVGYGHKPYLALRYGVLIIFIGWMLFTIGFQEKLMIKVDPRENRRNVYQISELLNDDTGASASFYWYALVYSCDTFIPLVNLQTSSQWLPTAYPEEKKLALWGLLLCIYRWLHIIMGWVLSTLFAVGIGKMVRK